MSDKYSYRQRANYLITRGHYDCARRYMMVATWWEQPWAMRVCTYLYLKWRLWREFRGAGRTRLYR